MVHVFGGGLSMYINTITQKQAKESIFNQSWPTSIPHTCSHAHTKHSATDTHRAPLAHQFGTSKFSTYSLHNFRQKCAFEYSRFCESKRDFCLQYAIRPPVKNYLYLLTHNSIGRLKLHTLHQWSMCWAEYHRIDEFFPCNETSSNLSDSAFLQRRLPFHPDFLCTKRYS